MGLTGLGLLEMPRIGVVLRLVETDFHSMCGDLVFTTFRLVKARTILGVTMILFGELGPGVRLMLPADEVIHFPKHLTSCLASAPADISGVNGPDLPH